MKQIHVAPSPLTNRIYAGHVLKDGCTWGANKCDVTGEACAAVAKHAIEKGGTAIVTSNGVPAYEITVRELTPNDLGNRRAAFGASELTDGLEGGTKGLK